MQLRKLLQLMRLTAFILLTACLQVAARTEGQNITLSVKNVPVKQVFVEIQRQTGLNVLVRESLLEKIGKVTVQVENRPVHEVLEYCFKDQSLIYTIDGGMIVVREKPIYRFDLPVDPLPVDIKGRVVGEGIAPIEGATITIKGTRKGTTTNSNGEFTLTLPNGNAILVVTAVGIEPIEVAVNNRPFIVVLVQIKPSQLDQVKIIGYGSTTERLSTGSVSTVKAEDIAKQPVGNPLAALQGRVTGMTIVQNTGTPGGSYNVLIRGLSSLTQSNEPLYIIDGVPYPAGRMGTINTTLSGGNPLNYVNNADIESISVLKDADATAIYGSRGANGVILITTKKGKAGKAKVDINVYTGIGTTATTPKLLNTQEYLAMRHEAKRNDNAPILPIEFENDINGVWDSTRYTNWQKELLGNTAHTTDAQLSISGGSSNSQYLLSAGYRRQTTVMPGSGADQKGSVHFSMNNVSADNKLTTQLSGSYIAGKSDLPTVDFTGQSGAALPPNAPALYKPDGSINWDGFSVNPIAQLNQLYTANSYNLLGSALISYRPVRALELKATLSYNSLQLNEFIGSPSTAFNPATININRNSTFGNYNNRTWIIEPQANYNAFIGKGSLNVLAGATFQKNVNNRQNMTGSGYSSDALLQSISAAPSLSVSVNNNFQYKYNAVFGRINYNWANKYILNLNARYDGSSRFGPANQFHFFGSAAGAWIFSEEKFMKRGLPFLSFGKLTASYGSTGNDKIGEYSFLDLLIVPTNAVAYQNTTVLTPRNLFNAELAWELTRKAEIGIDLGFFKDNRLLVKANYFRNRTSNQLLPYSLSIVTGFPSLTMNLPALVENTGIELELTSINIRNRHLTWSSSFNFYMPRNKLVEYEGLATSSFANVLVIGEPMTIQKIYNYAGVDPQTGVYTFRDRNGNITANPAPTLDQTQVINPVIRYSGGFNNSVDYKGFTLDFTFYYVKQTGPNAFKQQQLAPPGFATNTTKDVLRRWQKPGDITDVRGFTTSFFAFTNQSIALNSTKGYGDASYIRLNNLSLAYRFPEAITKKLHLQNLRLYAQGQNLLTISDYGNLDPENMSGVAIPPLRIITAGIQITL